MLGRVGLSLAILITLFTAHARAQDFRGTLVGAVNDTSGARIPSAELRLHAPDSSLEHVAHANERGEFRFSDLLPGSYLLSATARNFASAESQVTVLVSSTRSVEITLAPAALAEHVTVSARPSSVAPTPLNESSATLGGVVTRRELENIPLANRSFANIAYLVPGTEPVEPSDPTKARITAVSVGGSSGLNNVLSVDGGDNSDDYIGGFLQNVSTDAIQEFAVRTAQEDAETGRTVGGSVVITTRRGSNDWHGTYGFYERAAALNARYPIENPAPLPKQPFSRQNYIATLGGPIKKDKLWFFSSFEAVHEDASIAYSPASLTQFHALASLAAQGLIPGVSSISVPDNVSIPFRDYLGTMRFDYAQSTRSQWFARAAIDNYTTENAFVQQATLSSTGATWHNNYLSLVAGNQFQFTPAWLGSLTVNASGLHLTEARNSDLGFALAFPFSSTAQTVSGFETFGDNQFVTPVTAFPILRNQQKYQTRYTVSHNSGRHATRFGVDFIHEPVLSGALPGTAENLTTFALNPSDYLANPQQFAVDRSCAASATLAVTPGTACSSTPAANGSFSQSVRRLGLYAQDSWRVTPALTINYGLRYDTSFGLFTASNRSQFDNPALLTIQAFRIPLFQTVAAPQDYRRAIAPRIGLAYALGAKRSTVLRAGFGLFYNDLAQNGWVTAFQAVNSPPGPCRVPGDAGCLSGAATGSSGALIDPAYKTPYALHANAGAEHSFSQSWLLTADWTHEEGVHGYRRYDYTAGVNLFSSLFAADAATQQHYVPDLSVFRTDNRSRYDAFSIRLQGNVGRRLNLTTHYTLASAETWGCVLGELFDYVNGVCDPRNAFGKGDYGPSGEDVRHRFVVAAIYHAPGGFDLSLLGQAESARPYTITTSDGTGRAVINGVETTLDQFRGTPYIQFDLRVARPFTWQDRYTALPFIEFFNLLNRNNPGANYVTNIAAFPTQPVTSVSQVHVPAGGLGDFFGPGTTVGIPFAAQIGLRFQF